MGGLGSVKGHGIQVVSPSLELSQLRSLPPSDPVGGRDQGLQLRHADLLLGIGGRALQHGVEGREGINQGSIRIMVDPETEMISSWVFLSFVNFMKSLLQLSNPRFILSSCICFS